VTFQGKTSTHFFTGKIPGNTGISITRKSPGNPGNFPVIFLGNFPVNPN